jgi:hypothetical protein
MEQCEGEGIEVELCEMLSRDKLVTVTVMLSMSMHVVYSRCSPALSQETIRGGGGWYLETCLFSPRNSTPPETQLWSTSFTLSTANHDGLRDEREQKLVHGG